MEDLPFPWQNRREWFSYIEFMESYFKNREIKKPLVVEIGVAGGESRAFYENLLGAEYIGIDKSAEKSMPDILGDCRNKSTMKTLMARLAGRPVDLLFIDGNHVYQFVKWDYLTYGPLVRKDGGIIAFHDIMLADEAGVPSVNALWSELLTHERKAFFYITFYDLRGNSLRDRQMGIGLLIKKTRETEAIKSS